ncbi:MAG TPA: response regulator transcription factor [Candidatus Limnocylindrales bacterium]|nr:response regulator transcription factor [Candidatus Limnocylindrales bacterium]
MRILAVEDEPAILRMLERGLSAAGHQVVTASRGEDAALLAMDDGIDLVLLDISLPELSGHEVLSRIRARRPELPVLMLTARDDLDNKVRALDAGADDYLTKPFAFEELLARIRALTRRADQGTSTQLAVGDVRLDLLARRAWRAGRPVELSNREFALLEYLLRHPGQVLSRIQILFAVWEYDADPSSNVIDVYIRYLRRKLGEPSPIRTVRGAGYRYDPEPNGE